MRLHVLLAAVASAAARWKQQKARLVHMELNPFRPVLWPSHIPRGGSANRAAPPPPPAHTHTHTPGRTHSVCLDQARVHQSSPHTARLRRDCSGRGGRRRQACEKAKPRVLRSPQTNTLSFSVSSFRLPLSPPCLRHVLSRSIFYTLSVSPSPPSPSRRATFSVGEPHSPSESHILRLSTSWRIPQPRPSS